MKPTQVSLGLGKRVRIGRARLKMTQSAFARATGLCQQAVSRLENGQIWLTEAVERRICRVLGPAWKGTL